MRPHRRTLLAPRRRRAGLAVLFSFAAVGSLTAANSSAGAAPDDPTAPTATFPSVEFVGSQSVPSFGSQRSSALDIVGSPDHSMLHHVSGSQIIDVDISSGAFTGAIGGDLDDILEPGTVNAQIIDVVVNRDGTVAYVLYSDVNTTAPYRTWVRPLDLTTGEFGASSLIAEGTQSMSKGSITLADDTSTLYVYLSNYTPVATSMPTLFVIDAGPLSVTGTNNLSKLGFTTSTDVTLGTSADGTEVYTGTDTQIGVFAATDFTDFDRTITRPGRLLVVHDDTPSVADLGSIYVAGQSSAELAVIDPDDSDTVTSLTTVPELPAGAGISAFAVDAAGNAVLGLRGTAGIAVVDPGTGVVATAESTPTDSGRDPFSSQASGVWIDVDPTHGTCYFVADSYFQDIAAYSVGGADCGGFVQRFDPVEGPLAVDATLSVTYDAGWTGSRAEPWAGIVVFVDCQPAQVIRPPLSGSEQIRWRDVLPGTTMQIRSYTATQLDALGIAGLDDVTCSTFSADQLELALDYLPLQATAVVGGDNFSCALADGKAYCWGDGNAGTLGDGAPEVGQFSDWADSAIYRPVALPGTVDSSTTPVTITPDTSGGQLAATAISSTNRHVCALADASVVCWGLNSDGQLGVGPTSLYGEDSVDDGSPTRPLDVPNDAGHVNIPVPAVPSNGFTNTAVTAMSAGDDHTCAVDDGRLFCWGYNRSGRLGDGTTNDTDVAVPVSSGGGFTNTAVTDVAAGFDHTCAIEAGSVYCWGRNSSGALGDGTTDDRTTPVEVLANDGFLNTDVTALIATDGGTCAIESGSVYCWGEDDAGKLGDGDPAYANSPLPKKVIDVAEEGFTNADVTAIGGGENHVCAVASGSVFCWGLNSDDQLGRPDPYSVTSALKVPDVIDEQSGEVIFENTGILAVGAGFDHTCAATETGAFCWGENGQGRLGIGVSTSGDYPPSPVCCSALPQFELSVDVDGDGSVTSDVGGIDCPGTCSADITVDEVVTLTATPDSGKTFEGWSGDCSGTTECVVTMSEARSVNATFGDPPPVDLTVVISAGGSVQISGVSCTTTCTVPVDPDTEVTLTAVPAPGYVFLGWGGPCSGTGVCVVSLSSAGEVTASFGPVPTLPATGGSPWPAMVAAMFLAVGIALSRSVRPRPMRSRP